MFMKHANPILRSVKRIQMLPQLHERYTEAKIVMPTVCGLYYVEPTSGTMGCRYYAL